LEVKLKTIQARTKTVSLSLRCPTVARWVGDLVGCGSTQLIKEDDEGFLDCLDCGLFFKRDAALETRLSCPAKLTMGGQICNSTNLIWHEEEQQLECGNCGNHFSESEAIKLAQR
jgi:uncharacterized C2H2 Zn-finger protein